MKVKNKILSIILSFMIVIPFCGATSKPIMPKLPAEAKEKRINNVQGVIINTFENGDFPLVTNMHNNELTNQIKMTMHYLDKIGINTIFYESVRGCEAMYNSKLCTISKSLRDENTLTMNIDPLKVIIQEAKKYNIDVYALINPYYVGKTNNINLEKADYSLGKENFFADNGNIYLYPNETVQSYVTDISLEMAKKYEVSGIIYQNLDDKSLLEVENYTSLASDQFMEIRKKIKALDSTIDLGIYLDGDTDEIVSSFNISSSLLEKLAVDVIMAKISSTTNDNYEKTVNLWQAYSSKYGASLITVNNGFKILSPNDDDLPSIDRFELNYQAIINEKLDAAGVAINSLSTLLDKFSGLSSSLSTLFLNNTKIPEIQFRLANVLRLDVPITGIIYTTDNDYYISGTSDPQKPLYINGELYTKRAENGTFGIKLQVNDDENIYKFSQGEKTYNIEILKKAPPEKSNKKIYEIDSASTYPNISQFVNAEDMIDVKCVAPSGSQVTATLDSMSVKLKQIDYVETGYPAIFMGKIKAPSKYSSESVFVIGKISYAMTNDGKINFSKSNGNIFIAGKNSKKAVEVDDYITMVYDNADGTNPIAIMKIGAKDYVVDENKDYYKIKSDGYIKKSSTRIIAGNVKIESTYSTYITENDDKSETFTLIGTNAPNVKSNMTDNSVILTFYNTTALPDIVPIKTELFKNIMKVKVAENTYQLHFIFKTGIKPAGFDFKYTGENYKDFKITFNYYRKLSDDVTKPLTNISVLLDPGCGGKDVGNMSVAGIYGPTEKEINLAVALNSSVDKI
ncbi:MAG: family 10 glycosylhydrolase [Oscillospiraceae bacterium]